MSDQTNIISRIQTWFRKPSRGELPPMDGLNGEDGTPPLLTGTIEPRSTFLRPWAKRDQAIDNLQNGVVALSDLMNSIRGNMEKQSERQDELMQYLAHLPQALQALPETSRLQAETLEAIQQQMESQSSQQSKLAEILERISHADSDRDERLTAVHDRVEALGNHDQRMTESLQEVGTAMATVSKNSGASAQVLEQMRDNLSSRDGELEKILHRQGTRFTTLLAVAIFLSIAALVAVGIFGYLAYETLQNLKH